MAGFRQLDRKVFPLQDIPSVVKFFKKELDRKPEPDLALLSIIVGAIENSMTCNRPYPANNENDEFGHLVPVEYHIVETLYTKFHTIIKSTVDMSLYSDLKYATRELVKRVSDVIWNSLTRSYYKDRAHLQSLYSYLTGNKLDCFGVAFAVVAACQVLGFSDVHLALSEDHTWVVFGENGDQTAEVTWHGKGSEDKRGQEVTPGVGSHSWLYVNGYPIICDRWMEVAALVSTINPSLSITNDVVEVALLQQELLWVLYDLGHLAQFPIAIGNLADLEEINPTQGRPPCSSLFQEAILSARKYYNNQHVYPYTYQAGYFYRHNMYKEAFESWANASDVIRLYNYSRDDEEIYKELMEIANELIPHIMKVVSSGHSARSILKDPECFAYLLRFYDGICQWEEGSPTPVLHIGWAKPLVNTISKFDAEVRSQVVILPGGLLEGSEKDGKEGGDVINNNNDCCKTREGDLISSLESKVKDKQAALHPSIEALTAACGERILNRDFLIQGGGEPFVGGAELASSSNVDLLKTETTQPKLVLHSEKMRGLKDLLLAEKLNTHAISLQLTAQSQVQVGKKVREEQGLGTRPKRTRRE
ncbi:menin-like [Macrosteles quadrilineatus]|uniref:menin-like n=1 Tax=Macrosteles quadrilineatus TaxID=74068 RepID=UPI0023E0AC54|nr:menin-like [Macrosteles quadrilineatus]